MAEAKITNLFATLASHLETLNQSTPPIRREQEERSLDIAISELNHSLNLDDDDDSTVKFLDTALSAIGFKAPQVFDLVTEQLVEAIVTALSSSIACKALRFQISQALEIGSSISRRDCAEMITASRDVLIKFEENHVSGRLSNLLLDAVIRTAVSSSWYKYMFPLSPILDAKSLEWRFPAASVLLSHLPTEVCLEDPATPLRNMTFNTDFRNPRVTPEVIRDVCLLARMMAATLYYLQIKDFIFEIEFPCGESMWVIMVERKES